MWITLLLVEFPVLQKVSQSMIDLSQLNKMI